MTALMVSSSGKSEQYVIPLVIELLRGLPKSSVVVRKVFAMLGEAEGEIAQCLVNLSSRPCRFRNMWLSGGSGLRVSCSLEVSPRGVRAASGQYADTRISRGRLGWGISLPRRECEPRSYFFQVVPWGRGRYDGGVWAKPRYGVHVKTTLLRDNLEEVALHASGRTGGE